MDKTGGPAFPRAGIWNKGINEDYWLDEPVDGMSLRDYFAAQAVTKLQVPFDTPEKNLIDIAELVARMAYIMADAMLKEREK